MWPRGRRNSDTRCPLAEQAVSEVVSSLVLAICKLGPSTWVLGVDTAGGLSRSRSDDTSSALPVLPPEEQRVGDSHGSRCERAPATGCKPSPSPSAVSQVTCPLPDSPSSSLREQGTWTEPAQKASRTKTSEVRWAGQSGWAGHPGGRGLPSPGVKVRVERATPNTRPALGESGHPARLGSPAEDLHSHLRQGGWRHPGDQRMV